MQVDNAFALLWHEAISPRLISPWFLRDLSDLREHHYCSLVRNRGLVTRPPSQVLRAGLSPHEGP